MKHYDLWSLSQKKLGVTEDDKVQRQTHSKDATAPAQTTRKLDDLQTSLLLYNYGLPIDLMLSGTCKLPNGKTLNCTTKTISSERVDLLYAGTTSARYDENDVGSRVHINLDEIGDVKGVIASQNRDGFQVTVDADLKSSLSTKLAVIASQRKISHDVTIAAGPDIQRLELEDKNCSFEDHDGRLKKGTIVNISKVDAVIRAQIIPPKGAIIRFKGPQRYPACVTSVFVMGFMATFTTPINTKDFSPRLRFTD